MEAILDLARDGFLINSDSLASLNGFGTSPDFMEEFTMSQKQKIAHDGLFSTTMMVLGQGGMIWI